MSRNKFLKIFFKIATFTALILAFVWGGYFVFKIGSTGKKISIDNESSSVMNNVGSLISSLIPNSRKMLRGEEDGRTNILLLGTAGKGKPGQNLTDTIMMLSIDTKNKKIALLSLPRDFYAKIADTSFYTKINSIYQYGISRKEYANPIKKTVEEITGSPVHYFIVLDFDGFKKIIDDIGGINISVERDIYDPRYPGPNYSYETFEIKKGLHLMNGETALKYVRERHDDPEGDFGRAKRQQQVMQSTKNKVFSLQTFLNPIALNKLLSDLGENIKTDIGMDEIEGFLDLAKKSDTQNITNAVVDAWKKESILKVSHIPAGGVQAFVLVPRVGNYSEIQDLTQNIFDLDSIRRRKAEIEKENASVTIINQSNYRNLDSKVKDILENKMKIKNIKTVYSGNSGILNNSYVYGKTNGQKIFTLDEIIKILKIRLVGKNDAIIEKQESDLVLVLGNDLGDIDSFEEGNIEEFKNASDSQNYFDLIKK
ncbi:MAG: LCP family protein [Parcubacteria group bacterium]|jgi:LCP family protein required for cell wall assembly